MPTGTRAVLEEPEGRTLLAEVCARPDDDAPRLVLADWLSDRGDPLGSFVAEQIRLERTDETDPEWPSLYASTERALARYRREWTAPLLELFARDPTPHAPIAFGFSRGFVEEVRLPAWHAVAHLDELPFAAPIRRACVYTSRTVGLADILEATAVKRIPELALLAGPDGQVVGRRTLRELRSGALSHLRALALHGVYLDRAVQGGPEPLVAMLAEAPLRALTLEYVRLAGPSLDALANAGVLDALTELDLTLELDLDPLSGVLERLGEVGRLRRLTIGSWTDGTTRAPLERLLDGGSLEALSLGQIGTSSAASLLYHEGLATLRHLRLGWAARPVVAGALADVPFSRLTRLDLSGSPLGRHTARLAASPHLRQLVSLELGHCLLGDEDLGRLLGSPHLRRLVELDLSDQSPRLSSSGAGALADWPGLPLLTRLRLSLRPDDDGEAIRALAAAPRFDPARIEIVGPAEKAPLVERFGSDVVA